MNPEEPNMNSEREIASLMSEVHRLDRMGMPAEADNLARKAEERRAIERGQGGGTPSNSDNSSKNEPSELNEIYIEGKGLEDFTKNQSSNAVIVPERESWSDADSSIIQKAHSGEPLSKGEVQKLIDFQSEGKVSAQTLSRYLGSENTEERVQYGAGGGAGENNDMGSDLLSLDRLAEQQQNTQDTRPNTGATPASETLKPEDVINRMYDTGTVRTPQQARPERDTGHSNEKSWATSLEDELRNIESMSFDAVVIKTGKVSRGNVPAQYSNSPRAQAAGAAPNSILERALADRMNELMSEAENEHGLFEDIHSETNHLERRLAELEIEADERRISSRDPRFGQLLGSINGVRVDNAEEPKHLKGIRSFKLRERKAELMGDLDLIKREIGEYEETTGGIENPSEYLKGIQFMKDADGNVDVDKQRLKVRRLLAQLESQAGSKTGEKETKALLEYVNMDPRNKDKGLLAPDIEKEVRAALRLMETTYSLSSLDQSPDDFARNIRSMVTRLKSNNFLPDTEDFNKVIIEGFHGLDIQAAFNVLQEAAYEGYNLVLPDGRRVDVKYRSRMDKPTEAALDNVLISKVQDRTRIADQATIVRSLQYAKMYAEATFEDKVWDTSASNPVSEAIYFRTYRRSKNPPLGSSLSLDQVLTLGTSFNRQLRQLKVNDGDPDVTIFNSNLDAQAARAESTLVGKNIKNTPAARVYMWKAYRKVTPEDVELYKKKYQTEWAKKNNVPRAVEPNWTQSQDELNLEFDAVDYKRAGSGAYEQYLTSYVPAMIEAKKYLTETRMSRKDLDQNARKMVETVRKLDPNGRFALDSYMIASIIYSGHEVSSLDYDYSQVQSMLLNFVNSKILSPQRALDVAKATNIFWQGLAVTVKQQLEGQLGIRLE